MDRRNEVANFWGMVFGRKCFPWPGGRIPKGYGLGLLDGKRQLTHRIAYQLMIGPIPKGKYVCHKCDNPPCCNPGHLFLGSNADNIHDAVVKKRMAWGMRHYRAKLTNEQVRDIRTSQKSDADLARKFKVSRQLIGMIKRRIRWGHLT